MSRLVPFGTVVLSMLTGAGGCKESTCDPDVDDCSTVDEEHAYTGDVQVELVTPGCSGTARWVDLVLVGRASSTTLEMVEFADDGAIDWSERHPVPSFSRDADGWWDDRYVELEVVDTADCEALADCADLYDNGTTTLFACDDEQLTHVLRVTDANDRDRRLCVAWGDRVDLVEDCNTWETL